MRRTWMVGATAVAVAMLSAGSAGAQGRGRSSASVPPAMRPPEGLCRVWVDGKAPGEQEGVSDCAYARAHVPAGGRVLEGKPATAGAVAMNEPYAPYYFGPAPVTKHSPMHAVSAKAHHTAKARRSGRNG